MTEPTASPQLTTEQLQLSRVLRQNGYPSSFIRSAAHHPNPHDPVDEDTQPIVSIPDVAGMSEEIRHICRGFNLGVVFWSGCTLCSLLTKEKDTLPQGKQSWVVYRIPCSCGKVYIGETVRRLETRLKEHQKACREGTMATLAVAEHMH